MPRIRTIRPEIWDHPDFAAASDHARLTYLGLISLADDKGRGRADSRIIHGRLFHSSPSPQRALTEDSLRELDARELVLFYRPNGATLYWLEHWDKHQKIDRPTPSLLPEYSPKTRIRLDESSPPDMDRDREMDRERDGAAAGGLITKQQASNVTQVTTTESPIVEEWERAPTAEELAARYVKPPSEAAELVGGEDAGKKNGGADDGVGTPGAGTPVGLGYRATTTTTAPRLSKKPAKLSQWRPVQPGVKP